MIRFKAKLQKFADAELWFYHFRVEAQLAHKLIDGKNSRVLCSIKGDKPFQCAIMRRGDDQFFINVNKSLRLKYELGENSEFMVELKKDESEFGLPFPEEFKQVLLSDTEASKFFDQLTPGKKRNLLYLVNKVKSEQKRIEKSLVIAAHLKEFKGKIDFKALNESFKNSRFL